MQTPTTAPTAAPRYGNALKHIQDRFAEHEADHAREAAITAIHKGLDRVEQAAATLPTAAQLQG